MKRLINKLLKRKQEHYHLATAGYISSINREAVIVVVDSGNLSESMSMWKASGNNLTQIASKDYPQGLDLWYAAMMDRCGIDNTQDFINLAAKGDRKKLTGDVIRELITVRPLKFHRNYANGCKDWRHQSVSPKDVAASTVVAYQMIVENIMQQALGLFPSKNIILVGFEKSITKEIALKYFDTCWFPPATNNELIRVGKTMTNNV